MRPATGILIGLLVDRYKITMWLIFSFASCIIGGLLFASGWIAPSTTMLFFLSVIVVAIWVVEFLLVGRYLASASGDDTIKIWEIDAASRTPKHVLQHDKDVWTVAFSPDGQYLASGSVDRTVRLWRVETGEEIAKLSGHTNDVASVTFSPDGRQLASSSFDRTIRLWDVADIDNAKPDGPPLLGHTQNVWSVRFIPRTSALVSGSADLSLRWWPTDWSEWPSMACDRLHNHTLCVSPQDVIESTEKELLEIAEAGKSACLNNF